ncbi:hypothetical protein WP3W18E01_38960 [Raoultella ornithinolytica]|jgi:hypothetical protein|uniref:Uncharacterized protein n=1 Tax=Raoultella ornithinolytica TaxID=54291 RepID=A0A1Y6GRP1_RAOOR|nr:MULTISPECIES: hypothetical protein [Raoultella]HDX8329162.1 hypothetical protein [Raoultella ornithinolytica CD1_MRS_4]AGJ87225.1 hypothetical protein RORB6_12720 [Raoultella ornithinolytica B6]ALQ48043.1 hypothetical protein ATN83_3934 [Raoultella ornithinolytica]ANZ04836.1 hypothetical protein HY59_05455 [Raoultella ornithinolytica]APB04738.1 hypothetical protein BK817_07000 [Raoultella ornithinolytica]
MKKVIVFFNALPAVVAKIVPGVTTILREYPNGEQKQLQIMSAEFPSLTGDHRIVHVASDRDLTSAEIQNAAIKLLS